MDEHTIEVIRKSSASTVVKVGGMAIGLLVSVFLGRTIGAEGVGIINLSNRIINVLLVVGLLGMRQVIIKEVAIAHRKKDFSHIGNVMHTAYWVNGVITLFISVTLILLSPWLADSVFNEPKLQYPLMIALLAMIPQVFSRIFSSGLVGFRKIWQSNLVEQTLSLVISGILLFILWLFKREITIMIVATCYAIGRIGVTLSVGIYWNNLFSHKAENKKVSKQLIKKSIPYFWVTAASVLLMNIDVIILGYFADSRDIGLYSVAARIALLSSFFLQVTNASVAPKIAALYESNELLKLEKMLQKVTKGLGIIGFFQLLIFIFTGKILLSIWGAEFIEGYWFLIILGIGQFVNISTGAVANILIMTGHEKIQKNIAITFLGINIINSAVLIQVWGALGAALAMAITLIAMNITSYIYVVRKTKIHTINVF